MFVILSVCKKVHEKLLHTNIWRCLGNVKELIYEILLLIKDEDTSSKWNYSKTLSQKSMKKDKE